ncbi:hypothetical protein PM082_021559 [Marasmius tenuissimus]|nr:hypothetical protein PM082_021559 [Marasmius tenuissimus]
MTNATTPSHISPSNPGSSRGSLGSKRKADSPHLDTPSQSQPPHPSSPRRSSNTLDDARQQLLKQYEHVAEKSVQDFLNDHVPPVANAVVDQVMTKLEEKACTMDTIPHVANAVVDEKTKSRKRKARRKKTKSDTTFTEETTPPPPPPPLQKGRVSGYDAGTPSSKQEAEAQAFRPLYNLITAVVELAAELNGFRSVTHSTRQERISGEKPNSSRPDSFLYLHSGLLKHLGWEQLLCPGELKKKPTDKNVLDNWAKVLWSMHHIMRNDPCRLFTFGFSMEDDQARLWYHARSGVFVSQPFDWIKDPKPLVRLILALTLVKSEHFSLVACQDLEVRPSPLCASHSQAEVTQAADEPITFCDQPQESSLGSNVIDWLYANHPDYLERIGIDSKMKRVLDEDGNIQYEVTVDGVVFVTEEVLCDFKADHATGRCTRVWVVYVKGGSRDEKFVLKDVWLEEGARVEGDKLRDLADLIEQDERPHEIPVVEWHRDHLLHVHVDEKLNQKVPGFSHKHRFIHLSSKAPGYAAASSIHSGSQRAESRGGPTRVARVQGKPKSDAPNRFHYRIVFKGKMTPLESVPCRQKALTVLFGIFRGSSKWLSNWTIFSNQPLRPACQVLWKHKRVHRDISSWNAYWDPVSQTGRLGDYDYLVEYGEVGTGTLKTGTPHFWSTEVEAGAYLYVAKHGPDFEKVQNRVQRVDLVQGPSRSPALAQLEERGESPESGKQPKLKLKLKSGEQPQPTPIFQHNLLHDLESVFWVSLWTYLYLIGPEDRVDGQADLVKEGRQILYEQAFPPHDEELSQLHLRGSFIGSYAPGASSSFLIYVASSVSDPDIRTILEHHYGNFRPEITACFDKLENSLLFVSGPPIPYEHPVFDVAILVVQEALMEILNALDSRTFPVTPLSKHRVVLEHHSGPDDHERWPDDEDTVVPSTQQSFASGSTALSRSSERPNKRQKGPV